MNLLFIVVLNILAVGYATPDHEEGLEVEDPAIRGWRKGMRNTCVRLNQGAKCIKRGSPCPSGTEACCDKFSCWRRNRRCCCPKHEKTTEPTTELTTEPTTEPTIAPTTAPKGGIFQFNQAKFSLSESVGSRDISVVIENIGNIQFGANLSLSLVDVNATVFLDYLPIAPSQFPKSLVFPGGVTSVTEILTFEIINDAAHEEDEVFKLELSLDGTSQSTATIGNQDTLIVVIKDDDPIEL